MKRPAATTSISDSGDLQRDEGVRRSRAALGRPTRPGSTQRRDRVNAGGAKRGSRAKEHRRGRRDRDREAKHAPVRREVEEKLGIEHRQLRHERAASPGREQQAERRAGARQQEALEHELRDQLPARRAEREPYADLVPARGGTGEEHACDVDAGNEEDQPDEHQERQERTLEARAHEVSRTGWRWHRHERLPEELRPDILHAFRRDAEHSRLDRSERRRGGPERLLRLEPNQHEEREASFLVDRASLSENEGLGSERHGDIESPTHFDPEKLRRRDADDRERRALERQARADGVGGASETLPPQPVTDHDDRTILPPASHVIFESEETADVRLHAERAEEASAHEQRARRLLLSAARQVERRLRPQESPGEERRHLLHPRPHLVVPARARLEAVAEREVGGDGHQPPRLRHRQRPQQQTVDDAEDRRVGADAERQRQHDDVRDRPASREAHG